MSELKYKTRSGSSTYGKPRVYLSFYKTDKDGAAGELCDDILRINNCAVFYYEDGVIPAGFEAREAELSQMQLFVLVCTPDYLSNANMSRDSEIFFALGHGIPVLPVIPCGNVISEFNALCARLGTESLHCLDRNEFAGDDRGYGDRLKEHLDYFLISDEDTAKIRDEFRACIFLSYRKIDREYARVLIRRIHALQKYYDIAVWYDDYLVPGRSFEDEIFEAMDRSDLFILAVTPNIVALNTAGEENYVVKKEYPEAVRRGKKIVAAELDRTDRTALLIKFDDIPECINAFDELALADSLSILDMPGDAGGDEGACAEELPSDNDGQAPSVYDAEHTADSGSGAVGAASDPEDEASDAKDMAAVSGEAGTAEHRYYIGLAYLNGISAEVDPAKAFELISSAADERFEPAMDRLVRMYRSGIAVPRDYSKAIEWQQKLVDLAEKRLQNDETAENAHQLMYRLGQMGNYLTEQSDDNFAVENYERMLRLADKYTEMFPAAGLYRDTSVVCNKLGDIYMLKQDYEKAGTLYEAGWRAARVLADQNADETFRRDYAVSCQKLGQVYRRSGEHDKAKDRYLEAYAIVSETMDKEPTAANIRDVYITEAMLGDTALETGDFADAEEKYRKSLRLRETVERETGADWAKRDISVIWEKLGYLFAKTGRTRDASDAFEQAVYTANELFEKTGLPVHEEELSQMCTRAGEFHLQAKLYDEADFYFRAALGVDEKKAAESGSAADRRSLSVSYNRLAVMYKDAGELEKAKTYFEKDYQIAKELAEAPGTPEARRDVELSCNYLGAVCGDLEEFFEAEEYYREGMNICIDLVRETDDPVYWDDLGVLYFNFYRMTMNGSAFDQAYYVYNKLAKEYPDNETYAERLAILNNLM